MCLLQLCLIARRSAVRFGDGLLLVLTDLAQGLDKLS